MRNRDYVLNALTIEQLSNFRCHRLQTVSFQFYGLICTTSTQKIWRYNAIAASGEIFDLIDPTVRRLWKAMKEQEVWLTTLARRVDGVAVCCSRSRKFDAFHHAYITGVCDIRLVNLSF